MKKLILLICLILLITIIGGCMLLLGGTNERELGRFISTYTDGEKEYFEYDLIFEEGLIQKTSDDYVLLPNTSTNDEAVKEDNTATKIVLESYITALSSGATCADGYEYLYDVLDVVFDISDEDSFSESLLLENQGVIYGAVNFYSRPSGRSGNLLTNENVVKGIYINIIDGNVEVIREFDHTAILAFNRTHLIAYKDKKVYSVDLSSAEETFLFKDKWWDRGPSYYNNFNVSFTDEDFLVYVNNDNGVTNKETLMACQLDGSNFTVLIDYRNIEY